MPQDDHRCESVRELYSSGRLTVARPSAEPSDATGLATVIAEFERLYRLNLPGNPPPIDLAATWGAAMFLGTAQCLVYRDLDETVMEKILATPLPAATGPSLHYSVDLTFRFLPDLFRLARAAAERDPLIEILMQWAARWPLSSVGIPGVEVSAGTLDEFANQPCLLRLYVDRIMSSRDAGRLGDSRVAEAFRTAVGSYDGLAGGMLGGTP